MHIDTTITLSQIVVFFTLVGAIWRVNSLLNLFSIEHEILIEDLCRRIGIKPSDLPTRLKKNSLWGRS